MANEILIADLACQYGMHYIQATPRFDDVKTDCYDSNMLSSHESIGLLHCGACLLHVQS